MSSTNQFKQFEDLVAHLKTSFCQQLDEALEKCRPLFEHQTVVGSEGTSNVHITPTVSNGEAQLKNSAESSTLAVEGEVEIGHSIKKSPVLSMIETTATTDDSPGQHNESPNVENETLEAIPGSSKAMLSSNHQAADPPFEASGPETNDPGHDPSTTVQAPVQIKREMDGKYFVPAALPSRPPLRKIKIEEEEPNPESSSAVVVDSTSNIPIGSGDPGSSEVLESVESAFSGTQSAVATTPNESLPLQMSATSEASTSTMIPMGPDLAIPLTAEKRKESITMSALPPAKRTCPSSTPVPTISERGSSTVDDARIQRALELITKFQSNIPKHLLKQPQSQASKSPGGGGSGPRLPVTPPQRAQPKVKYLISHIRCLQTDCSQTLVSPEQLDMHMQVEHQLGAYLCPQDRCNRRYGGHNELLNHFYKGHRGRLNWKCVECGQMTTSGERLYGHYVYEHQAGRYQCSLVPDGGCSGFTATYPGEVIRHFDSSHE